MAEEGKKPEAPEEVEESATAAEAETPVSKSTEDPNKPVKDDSFEIRVNSYKVIDAFGITAVHNEVAIYRNGAPLVAFNGNAHDNQTGQLNTFAINPGSTLRVSGGDNNYGQGANPMQLVGSVTLASNLTSQEFLDKLKILTAASHDINNSKIEYVVVGGLTYEAQNSNSVATTLITAMGYKYPENEFSGLWAPGAKRNLLPDNWKPTLSNEELVKALEGLSGQNVGQQVRDEKIPVHRPEAGENYFPNLHDPNKAEATKAKGFSSATDAGIKVDQPLTGSFAEAADGTPKRPEPAQELPGVVISKGQPAQNQDSYAAAPEVARR